MISYSPNEVLANDIIFSELNKGAFRTEIQETNDTKLELTRI
jgi:hypothetical protein